ncbi:MAG: hypothetical protein IKT27_02305 [Clostridia bacterium]|nr:hypothetical protein [Clostridia bacterium]
MRRHKVDRAGVLVRCRDVLVIGWYFYYLCRNLLGNFLYYNCRKM